MLSTFRTPAAFLTLAGLAAACAVGTSSTDPSDDDAGVPGRSVATSGSSPSAANAKDRLVTLPKHFYETLRGARSGGAGPEDLPNDQFVSLPQGAGSLNSVTGSFPMEVGGTNEVDSQAGADDPGANSYSLQLNTNPFKPTCSASYCTACAKDDGDASTPGCLAVEQFVYDAPRGQVFIQDWMIAFPEGCPSGWTTHDVAATATQPAIRDCYITGASGSAPILPASALQGVSLTASTSGASDTVSMAINGATVGTGAWTSPFGAWAAEWVGAEFNVFGNAGGTVASFGDPTELEVELVINSASPETTNAPSCTSFSVTAESSNLTIDPCCAFGGARPGMQFFETNITTASSPTCPSLIVSPVPLEIPADSGGTGTATLVLAASPVDPTIDLWPTTCTITGVPTAAGKVTGSTTPFFGALNATFTLPSTAVAGDSFQADIACTDGLTATEVVNVTSPAFYPYPTTTALEDGNCVDIPLVWSEDLFDCSGVTYQLTNTTLPAGVTADIVASGIEIGGGFAQETLAVCGNVPLTEMLSFKFQVTSNGCFGGPYEANGTVNLVPPPPCVPSTTCPANSCEGSVPNGCGGTISCPTTCASPLVCSSGKCVSPTPTCPSGEDYCTETAECMTPAACARAGGGSSSGGCKGTSCM